jgi:hypothetical protein
MKPTKTSISIGLLFALFMVASNLSGQSILYLKKHHSAKRKMVKLYDIIKVKTIQDSMYMGTLNELSPNMIAVGDNYIKIEDIKGIKTYNMLGRSAGRSLQYGAVLFTAVFITNSIITGDRPLLTEGNWVFIGSLAIAGVVLELISSKWHRLDKNWDTEVILMNDL